MKDKDKLLLMFLLSLMAIVLFLLIGASLFKITSILEGIGLFVERLCLNVGA